MIIIVFLQVVTKRNGLVLRKEFALKSLFEKRQTLLNHIPDFWPTVFLNGPEEVQQFFSPNDLAILASIKSFSVERYQIKSQTEGEPRSLRFTFQFEENEIFEDQTLVKEFEYKPNDHGPGNLISKPVPIKWKGKKKDVTNGLLTAAVELHAAEEALKVKKGDQMVDIVEREGLWQYEKLREKLVQAEESTEEEPSFINWFGFRGAVAAKVPENDKQNGDEEEDDDVDDDDDEAMLDVEVFPAGEEVAIALAEDLWPNVMDYFSKLSCRDLSGNPN